MTLINIYIDNVYACHIAYIASLLKLDFNIISPSNNLIFNFNEFIIYYDRMVKKLYERTSTYLETNLFEIYIKNKFTFYNSPPELGGIDIYLINSNSIKDAENEFYENLYIQNIIPVKLYQYETNFNEYRQSLQWSIETILERVPSLNEIDELYIKNGLGLVSVNDSKFTNLFSWLHILYFSKDSIINDRTLDWVQLWKAMSLTIQNTLNIPKIAVILSGYSRDYLSHFNSHKLFIYNPYIDIFIHTWVKKGSRYSYQCQNVDINDITLKYDPKTILVEDEQPMKNIFSLRGRFYPIFLKWGQEGDDATRYVNSKLYSTWKAMTLILNYEQANSFTYTGIMKLNFNVDIIDFDIKGILSDIIKPAVYSPNNFYNEYDIKTGGCKRCDLNAKYNIYNHTEHSNDIFQVCFYGNHDIGKKACELYLEAENIIGQYQSSNVSNYQNVHHKVYNSFVYIQGNNHKIIKENDLSKNIICYHPDSLLKVHMSNYACLSTQNLSITATKWYIGTNKL